MRLPHSEHGDFVLSEKGSATLSLLTAARGLFSGYTNQRLEQHVAVNTIYKRAHGDEIIASSRSSARIGSQSAGLRGSSKQQANTAADPQLRHSFRGQCRRSRQHMECTCSFYFSVT
ncbi:hypothetical protein DOTSEDRAFT_73775 [Dothistroma septosporum NZE10]|uniref:Uncharacterized protein n=1 Tax=Dothistroma septosporum (strain NZE10 / CBS 128990) TaxID=675120 RepID=N1PJF5_DOTSN|nr:hypothetical protein DOTSEDRAFT_73775 [Dothistroma septosporum NZE10]